MDANGLMADTNDNGGVVIESLRGGMNNTDPANMLAPDECVLMENVEIFFSTMGERRQGCIPLNLAGSGLENQAAIVHISEWFPTNVQTLPEWWAVGATVGVSVSVARRDPSRVWHAITPDDAILSTTPYIYSIQNQPLTGIIPLNFFTYASAVDRMHVWDGTYLRRSGLAAPTLAPTGSDTGGGAYATVRYFRVRFVEKDGLGRILRRSEPSPSLPFTPSGAGSGAVVTRPALVNEHETHWELEAAEDNATFYRIASTAVGTVSVTDSTAYATGYSGLGPLSEDVGTYLLVPSVRFLAADSDRLLFGGHQTDSARQSSVYWSPVFNDPGAGNFERLPLSVNNSVNLDNGAGGPLTGISSAINGVWYAFKWSRIYAMVRTNNLARAYEAMTLSSTQGAVPGSIFEGGDEAGRSCIYFLDPMTGPMRVGPMGLQSLSGLRTTWGRVNLHASLPSCGVYYPYKQQAIWWIPVDGSDTPNLVIKNQITAMTAKDGIVRRGWTTATGRIAEALCAAALTEVTLASGVDSLSARPCIGLSAPDLVQICDVGSTDAGDAFIATILTRPYIIVDLLNRWGVMCASCLAGPSTTTKVQVTLIRDFGKEFKQVTMDLVPEGLESFVIKDLDDLRISDARVVQIQFNDPE